MLAGRVIFNDPKWGIAMMGFSTLGFGVACFLQGDFTIFRQPVPENFPFRQPLAFISAAALVLSGGGLLFSRTRQVAAIVQVGLFFSYALSWLSVLPQSIQPWLGIAEHLAIVVGALTIWARLSPATA